VKVYEGLESLDPPLHGVVLTIGNFDGVHRGHQQILAQAAMFSAQTGGPLVVLTFEPHPRAVLRPGDAPARLTPLREKLALLARAEVRATVVVRSEPALLQLAPDEFVERMLVGKFHPCCVVEGESWGFGRGREGNVETLRALGCRMGFEVFVVPSVTLQIEPGRTVLVTSTLIRRLLRDGQVHRAALCLGRPYALLGQVARGERVGGLLGFPTANVQVQEQLIPADGVYAAVAEVAGQRRPAAVHVGPKPTFGREGRGIEAHLLDFDGQIYGEPIRLELLRRLRGPRKFETSQALQRQIHRDLRQVRAIAGQAEWSQP